ncbi:MAG: hypothetical protein JRJ57_00210 [Deltaproteobacteria bacterium]|nr:hypothetical protein [Deltaproteobacteria bacterium]
MAAPTHKAIYELIKNVEGVSDIGHRKVLQTVTLPYVAHYKISGPPTYSKDGDGRMDIERHQVSIYAGDDDSCHSIAEQVRTALNDYRGTVQVDGGESSVVIDRIRLEDENDGFDDQDNAVYIIQDYIIRRKR